jgi:hypothetical protein
VLDYLLLKASLLTEGIRADPLCLREVGTRYKEQNHGLFGWDFENHQELKVPDDVGLEDGSVVQFRLSSRSPYIVRQDPTGPRLYRNEESLCDIHFIPRPGFYGRTTTSGNAMVKIGQVGGRDNLFFCYQNYCSHFGKNKQCAFCNLVSTSKVYDSVLKKKDHEEIGEVAGAAWEEGVVRHVNITGGCFNAGREVEVIGELLTSIRRHTGLDRVPGILLPSPAKGDAVQRYWEAGIGALGYSMEVWDDALFQAFCPGKAETTSHAEFVRSVTQAVKVFGPGNVYVMLVMGLETRETFLEGIRAASELGANVAPYVWAPNPGSKLSGHRAPYPEWYADTIRAAADIVMQNRVPSGERNNCSQCDGNTLLADALREKSGAMTG